uniref:Uncharacterized protein n=1 Tax=Arundo donax TaxID=35708 RepID=A0A0A9HXY8_ARUDO
MNLVLPLVLPNSYCWPQVKHFKVWILEYIRAL